MKTFLLSHRTIPNEAGDHRAARTVPLGQGAVRLATPKPPDATRASAASALAGHRTWRDLNARDLRLLLSDRKIDEKLCGIHRHSNESARDIEH